MDATIIVALIGAAAVITAAVISAVWKARKQDETTGSMTRGGHQLSGGQGGHQIVASNGADFHWIDSPKFRGHS